MRWSALLFVLLSGCSAPVAVLVGLSFFAVAYEDERDYGGSSRAAPELDPSRRINEVDCTKPIDTSPGNIRCK